jgi:hypothetical protein
MADFIDQADATVSDLTEGLARRLSRRQVVFKVVRGAALGFAAASTAGFAGVRTALAAAAASGCNFPGCGSCSCLGKTCPSNGCPSGCYTCTPTSGGCANCGWSDANWVCCTGCAGGTCGYRLCWDCRCTSCSRTCGCRSTCRCTGCCSLQDIEAALAREGELAGANAG